MKIEHLAPAVLAAAMVLITATAEAGRDTWTPLPIEGGRILELFVLDDTVFANSATHGLFRSRDRETWQRIPTPSLASDFRFARLLVATPDGLLAISGSLHRSLDQGDSWQPVLDGRRTIEAAADPTNGTWYAVTLEDGNETPEIFRSSDQGTTWVRVGEAPGGDRFIETGIFPRGERIYFAFGSALWRSDDGGASFAPLLQAPSQSVNADNHLVDPRDADTLLRVAVGDNGGAIHGLYRSQDGGMSWTRLSTIGQIVYDLKRDPRDPERLLAAAHPSGLLESLDGGLTWRTLPTPASAYSAVRSVAVAPSDGRLIIGPLNYDGLYQSLDDGASWRLYNQGLRALQVEAVAFGDGEHLVATPQGLHTLREDEAPILRLPRFNQIWSLHPATNARDRAFAVETFGRVWSTSDDGHSWRQVPSTSSPITFAFGGTDGDTLFEGAASLRTSRDFGATWTTLLDEQGLADVLRYISGASIITVASPSDAQIHWAASSSTGGEILWSSNDGGNTWQPNEDLPGVENIFIRKILVDPFDHDHLLVVDSLGDRSGRSTDGGRTLTPVDFIAATGLGTFLSALAFDPGTPGRLYAGGADGVARSDDGGMTWQPFNQGLDGAIVTALEVDPRDPRQLLAGTDRGVYRFTQVDRCTPSSTHMCLDDEPGDGRFEISLRFATALGGGREGDAQAISLAPIGVDRGGLLHFGNPANPEVLVKVLDGCSNNGHFWLFASAATTLGYELTIRDLAADTQRVYANPDGNIARTISDTRAFATCDVAGPALLSGSTGEATPATISRPSPATAPSASSGPLPPGTTGCIAGPSTLCIDDQPGDGRFRVRLRVESALGGGIALDAAAEPLGDLGVTRGGLLHFGNRANPEALVKVLDGCSSNGHFWFFASAATTLGFTLQVEDTLTGTSRTYENDDGHPASAIADTRAFATCGALPAGAMLGTN